MIPKKRMLVVIGLMVPTAAASVGAVLWFLYLSEIEVEKVRLQDFARRRAEFVAEVVRAAGPSADAPLDVVLAGVLNSLPILDTSGRTGELVIARQMDGQIQFLHVRSDSTVQTPPPVALSSNLAEPMSAAVRGEVGAMIGRDYEGTRVVAAYLPVPEARLAVVVKVDLAEVRAPLLEAGQKAAVVSALIVLLGLLVSRYVGRSILHSLDETRARLAGARSVGFGTGFIDWDLKTDEMEWSDEVYRMYGIDPGVVPTPQFTLDLVHPDDRERAAQQLREVFEKKHAYEIEHRVVRPDGEVIWVHAHGQLSRGKDGTPTRLLGTVMEITEARRKALALQHSEARFRTLVESMPGTVYVYPFAEGRYTRYLSPQIETLLGYDTDVVSSDPDFLRNRLHPDDRARVDAALKRLRESGQPLDCEYRVWHRDGSTRHLLDRGAVVRDADGKAQAVVGVMVDVTEQKELERQLQQAQKMEAVGELTSGVAHDLNNLLTVVLANAQTLTETIPADDEEAHAALGDILDAGKKGGHMIGSLLGFGKKADIQVEPVDLADVLESTTRMLRHLLPETIDIEQSTGTGARVVAADRNAIQQIVVNLCTNARDAMPEGGRLSITCGTLSVHDVNFEDGSVPAELHPGEYATVRVTDTGAGMDEETLSRALDPFFTTKTSGIGTGLGLSMAYGLMKQQDGFLTLESTPGEGTEVTLHLRLLEREEVEQLDVADDTGEPSGAPVEGTETILVVEDEEAILRSAVRVLTRAGYTVLTACDGEEAWGLLVDPASEIELVFTDLIMPRLGGKELFARARKHGLQVPFLVTTGYTLRETRDEVGLPSEAALLLKPWTPELLQRKIREILD